MVQLVSVHMEYHCINAVAPRAPDGSCILTCSDDNLLRIFNLPGTLYDNVNQCCEEEMVIVLQYW